MKTLETLYQEILASDELKKDLAQAAQSPEGLETWVDPRAGLRGHGERNRGFPEREAGENRRAYR